jgi:hypothetical protein
MTLQFEINYEANKNHLKNTLKQPTFPSSISRFGWPVITMQEAKL